MAPLRKSGGGKTPGEKQQRSIASFFTPSKSPSEKPSVADRAAEYESEAKTHEEAPSGNGKQKFQASNENVELPSTPGSKSHEEVLPGDKRRASIDNDAPPAKECSSPDESSEKPASPPESRVGKRLRVYWPLEDRMFSAMVAAYDSLAGTHKVVYDDGDEEELVLKNEKIEWLDDLQVERRVTRRTLKKTTASVVVETQGGEASGGFKRLRKRYVDSPPEESKVMELESQEELQVSREENTSTKKLEIHHHREEHQVSREENTSTKMELEIHHHREEKSFSKTPQFTPDPAKRRKLIEEDETQSGSSNKKARTETIEIKEAKEEEVMGVDCRGGAEVSALSVEALERFGKRVSEKFYFLGKGRLDASGRRPGSPNYDPRTLFLSCEFRKGLTGGQLQWWEFKAKHMDKVLLFKMGKFYEMFEMDAHVGAQDLDLQYMKGEQPHCGFPEKNYFDNVERLVRKGHRVLVVEQTETPEQLELRKRRTGAKDKVVRREICAVITRGTIVDSNMIGDNADPSYLLSITEKADEEGACLIGLCVADTSRALFMLGQVSDDPARTKLRSILTELRPVELVQPRGILSEATSRALREQTRRALISELTPVKEFWDAEQTVKEMREKSLENLSPVLKTLIDQGKETEPAISAFGGCISYLKQALLDSQLLKLGRVEFLPGSDLSLEPPAPVSSSSKAGASDEYMVLDTSALDNLEILENSSSGGVSGTLLSLLDHCITPFGRRLLKQWIVRPLVCIDSIIERQNAVQDMLGVGEQAVSEFRKELTGIPDLEKLLARLSANSAANGRNASNVVLYEDAAKKQIKELVGALRGCQKLIGAVSCFEACLDQLKSSRLRFLLSSGKGFPVLEPHLQYFEEAFDWTQAEATGKVTLPEAAGSSMKASDPKEELEKHLKFQRKFFKNPEISYVTVGKDTYLLEIPEELHAKVPSNYELRSSKKGYNRYWTREIKELLQELNSYENDRETALKGVLQELTTKFCEHQSDWLSAIRAVSELDALMSISCVRLHIDGIVCVPKFLPPDQQSFNARALRHPIVAVGAAASTPFVPNDVVLGGEKPHFVLLTGPNMGGKSTLLRQVCLAMILAQIGSEVPAESLELSPTDRLFVRMGAKDHIMSAQSTFLVELLETASMLRSATRHSFVALDELGRGTATSDGQAIAHAVLDYLAREVQCRGMFSSHYHKLASDHSHDQAIALHHMACEVTPATEAVTFLYKLTPGSCPKSYGVNVARLAGMPETILQRASLHSSKLELQEKQQDSHSNDLSSEALDIIRSFTTIASSDMECITSSWRRAQEILQRIC